jgi:hypothetical protein
MINDQAERGLFTKEQAESLLSEISVQLQREFGGEQKQARSDFHNTTFNYVTLPELDRLSGEDLMVGLKIEPSKVSHRFDGVRIWMVSGPPFGGWIGTVLATNASYVTTSCEEAIHYVRGK